MVLKDEKPRNCIYMECLRWALLCTSYTFISCYMRLFIHGTNTLLFVKDSIGFALFLILAVNFLCFFVPQILATSIKVPIMSLSSRKWCPIYFKSPSLFNRR